MNHDGKLTEMQMKKWAALTRPPMRRRVMGAVIAFALVAFWAAVAIVIAHFVRKFW